MGRGMPSFFSRLPSRSLRLEVVHVPARLASSRSAVVLMAIATISVGIPPGGGVTAGVLSTETTGSQDSSWTQTAKMTTPNATVTETGDHLSTDGFGFSVAISGNWTVVGADNARVGDTPYAGAAYVYHQTQKGWELTQKLTIPDPPSYANFGWSLAIDDDILVVGDTGSDTDAGILRGAAYVFERTNDTWDRVEKLALPDGDIADEFGWDVAVDGDRIAVGTPSKDTSVGRWAGAAYIFEPSAEGWTQTANLTPSDASANDVFGDSLDIEDDRLVVNAPKADTQAGANAGALYVFEEDDTGWKQEAKLVAEDAEPGDAFASAIALEADTVLAGAPSEAEPTSATFASTFTSVGSAYVFHNDGSGWNQTAKLVAEDSACCDKAGVDVALDDGRAVIGTYLGDGHPADNAGVAYLFARTSDGWEQTDKLAGHDPVPGDRFGWSVAIDGGGLVVGAPSSGFIQQRQDGAAYIFETCQEQGPVSSTVHQEGEPAIQNTFGSDAESSVHEENCQRVAYGEARVAGQISETVPKAQ